MRVDSQMAACGVQGERAMERDLGAQLCGWHCDMRAWVKLKAPGGR